MCENIHLIVPVFILNKNFKKLKVSNLLFFKYQILNDTLHQFKHWKIIFKNIFSGSVFAAFLLNLGRGIQVVVMDQERPD